MWREFAGAPSGISSCGACSGGLRPGGHYPCKSVQPHRRLARSTADGGAPELGREDDSLLFRAAQRRPAPPPCRLARDASGRAGVDVAAGGVGVAAAGTPTRRLPGRRGRAATAGRRALQLLVASSCCSILSLSAPSAPALPRAAAHAPWGARPPALLQPLRLAGGCSSCNDGLGQRREMQRDLLARQVAAPQPPSALGAPPSSPPGPRRAAANACRTAGRSSRRLQPTRASTPSRAPTCTSASSGVSSYAPAPLAPPARRPRARAGAVGRVVKRGGGGGGRARRRRTRPGRCGACSLRSRCGSSRGSCSTAERRRAGTGLATTTRRGRRGFPKRRQGPPGPPQGSRTTGSGARGAGVAAQGSGSPTQGTLRASARRRLASTRLASQRRWAPRAPRRAAGRPRSCSRRGPAPARRSCGEGFAPLPPWPLGPLPPCPLGPLAPCPRGPAPCALPRGGLPRGPAAGRTR